MKKIAKWGLAVLAILLAAGCASTGTGNLAIGSKAAGDKPPAAVAAVKDVPAGQFSHDYLVTIYPGLGKDFNPDPKLTLEEYNQLVQLDWYCTRQIDQFSGKPEEMVRQGLTYGGLEGFLGALGARLAFGPAVHAADYLIYIGATAGGGGLGSGKITYEMAMAVAHGYCMTGMVYKADELDRKLRRLFVVPVYTGKAKVPAVSDATEPRYPGARSGDFIPAPPR